MRLHARTPLLALSTLVAAGSAVSSAQPRAHAAVLPAVACRDAILRETTAGQRRVVLGVVSVPRAYYAPPVVRWQHDGWAYWQKAGLAIQAGSPVVRISVPRPWRNRVAIQWGGTGPYAALALEACSPPPTYWNAFSGGFSLRDASACVPLVIRVGNRTATVRFGVGRRCR